MSGKESFKNLVAKIPRVMMIMLALVGLVPAAEAHGTTRRLVNERVDRIRVRLRGQSPLAVPGEESPSGNTQLAQWGNAWTNWNNWRNWNNWANWGNWGNWHNIG